MFNRAIDKFLCIHIGIRIGNNYQCCYWYIFSIFYSQTNYYLFIYYNFIIVYIQIYLAFNFVAIASLKGLILLFFSPIILSRNYLLIITFTCWLWLEYMLCLNYYNLQTSIINIIYDIAYIYVFEIA